ncbi:Receptor-like protein EIX1 [Linum perenne]
MTSLCFPPEKSVCNGETSHLNCTNSDQRSLLDFKNGLIDADDRLSSWRGGSNCCEWWGVTCDSSTGAVISLQLHNSSLGGEIRPSLLQLESLQHLDLSFNDFSARFPSWLANLTRLSHLDLSSNRLVGKLPDWLGKLEALAELSLDNNLLQGPIPDSLGNLQNLTNLGISYNQLNGTLPDTFGKLSQLSFLDVSSNHLTGSISESHFATLAKLKILLLASNSLVFDVGSSWLPRFQARNLDLGSCQLGPSFPTWLRTQREVMYLDFSNASISDTIPTWFWDISSNLSLLNVSFNQLTGQLPNKLKIAPFADVDFSSNLFEGPMPLPSHGIELLDLSKNKFSGPIPEIMFQTMPDVIFLSLSGNRLSGDIPSSIGDSLSLQVIDLSNNSLSGNIPSTIGNCSFLKALDLSYNDLTAQIPVQLGQLVGLVSLNLSRNQITGKIPETISNMRAISSLDLSNNRLSGSIPEGMNTLTSLAYLNLSSNSLSGAIPTRGQMSTFEQSAFANNSGLCGVNIDLPCRGDDDDDDDGQDNNDGDEDGFIDEWFYLAVGVGFAAGIVIPTLVLAVKKPWSDAYFMFVDRFVKRSWLLMTTL